MYEHKSTPNASAFKSFTNTPSRKSVLSEVVDLTSEYTIVDGKTVSVNSPMHVNSVVKRLRREFHRKHDVTGMIRGYNINQVLESGAYARSPSPFVRSEYAVSEADGSVKERFRSRSKPKNFEAHRPNRTSPPKK